MRILHRQIRLEAASFCQLRCPSCPTTSGAIHPAIGSGYLRRVDFHRLLADNPWLARIELANYGEVLLNPDILEILELAHYAEVEVTLDSGVNLNHAREPVLEGLVRLGVRSMTCSIDGASEETYRSYRVGGSLAAVIDKISRINRYKERHASPFPALCWQFLTFPHNRHEVPRARDMAAALGMTFRTKLPWAAPEPAEEVAGEDGPMATCRQLWFEPQVNWDGKILGCSRNVWSDFGGNAFTDGLVASLNGERIAYAREMLQGREPAREDIPCTRCDIYRRRRETAEWVEP